MAGKIVVGVDGSAHAAAALRWAAEEAALRSVRLEVVHAWTFVPVATPADSGLVPMAWTDNVELLDVTRRAAEDAAAAQVAEVLGPDQEATITVVENGPAEALLAAAADADLLVVGNRGRGNLAAAFLGSTSAKVADEAPCPVVVVRAQPES
ncbi:MAG TPA: universal stress protein [Gaiella sp.]|nr:universal stress protein [Gaiella sp.]